MWQAERRRAFYEFNNQITESDNDIIIRNDTGSQLGNVLTDQQTHNHGKARTWGAIDNLSLLKYAENIARDYGLQITKLFAMRNGQRVGVEMRTQGFNVYGHDHTQALTIMNGHTGKNSFIATASITDMICDNGQWWIDLSNEIARITHNGCEQSKRVKSDRMASQIEYFLNEQRAEYIEQMKKLESRNMSKTEAAAFFSMIYGLPTMRKNIDSISHNSTALQAYATYINAIGQSDYDDNALKVFNGLTAFETHFRGHKGNDVQRLERNIDGNSTVKRGVVLLSDIQSNRKNKRDEFKAIDIPTIEYWESAANDLITA